MRSTIEKSGVRHQQLLALTAGLAPIRTAVVHPVDENALLGTIEAAQAHLISPVLVGPEERIKAVAQTVGVDLSPFPIIATEHSHEAAE